MHLQETALQLYYSPGLGRFPAHKRNLGCVGHAADHALMENKSVITILSLLYEKTGSSISFNEDVQALRRMVTVILLKILSPFQDMPFRSLHFTHPSCFYFVDITFFTLIHSQI